jgi:nucleotide-binding universal stress UspA family protein
VIRDTSAGGAVGSGLVSVYRTVVVGTDGSESSLRAVSRAGALAGACGAQLVIACAYLPLEPHELELQRARAVLGEDAYHVLGPAPAEEKVRAAAERAVAGGAGDVRTVAVAGAPVEGLLEVVRDAGADLLVVGNRGLRGLAGRLLGSVSAEATRRSTVDVLVVHTTD